MRPALGGAGERSSDRWKKSGRGVGVQEFSVPSVATVAATTNLTDPVWVNAAEAPDVVQFSRRDGNGWRDVTCAAFRDDVVGLAKGLIAAGIQAGDRVALMSRTRYEWTLADYAIWSTGAVTVPIYETSSAEQVAWILSDSGAVACFVETPAHAAIVDEGRGRLTDLRDVWAIDGGDIARLVERGAATTDSVIHERRAAVQADDIATIIYTSGTTGRPKGCVLTHRNMYSDIANAIPGLQNLFREGASTLLFLPLAHSFARLIQIGVVTARARTRHTADIKNLVDELADFRPTFVLAVPRVFEKVYNTARQRAHADGKGPIFDRADRTAVAFSEALDTAGGPGLGLRLRHKLFDRLVYSKLRAALGGQCTAAISGGAPLGGRLAHFFRGIGVTVFEGYGLTETSPAAAVNLEHAIRLGTVGRPLPGVTIRVADDGEILIRGDLVFQGYWRNPAASAEALVDGWFRTGDLGSLDTDGYLRITGRKKELLVTAAGKNVAPAVLEDRLRAHPLVSQAMVVGDGKPFIAALVTIDDEAWPKWLAENGLPADATVEDMRADERVRSAIGAAIAEANKAVSHAEAIKSFRILPHDWSEQTGELTPSLKLKRNVVMKEYADEIAAIYS
jgi:long-chain acyl-CoA synthetase